MKSESKSFDEDSKSSSQVQITCPTEEADEAGSFPASSHSSANVELYTKQFRHHRSHTLSEAVDSGIQTISAAAAEAFSPSKTGTGSKNGIYAALVITVLLDLGASIGVAVYYVFYKDETKADTDYRDCFDDEFVSVVSSSLHCVGKVRARTRVMRGVLYFTTMLTALAGLWFTPGKRIGWKSLRSSALNSIYMLRTMSLFVYLDWICVPDVDNYYRQQPIYALSFSTGYTITISCGAAVISSIVALLIYCADMVDEPVDNDEPVKPLVDNEVDKEEEEKSGYVTPVDLEKQATTTQDKTLCYRWNCPCSSRTIAFCTTAWFVTVVLVNVIVYIPMVNVYGLSISAFLEPRGPRLQTLSALTYGVIACSMLEYTFIQQIKGRYNANKNK